MDWFQHFVLSVTKRLVLCVRNALGQACKPHGQQFRLRNISSAAYLPTCERDRETDRQTAVALLARVEHLALSP
jgi:hypothetical protein